MIPGFLDTLENLEQADLALNQPRRMWAGLCNVLAFCETANNLMVGNNTMRIHSFHHVPFENLGSIEAWIKARQRPLTVTRFYQDDALPDLDDIDCLIVMGGPMGACDDDRFPWLKSEKRTIERALQQGKWVIGICLGSQLIANVLGARVYANRHKEIGWFPIELTAAGRQSSLSGFLPDRLDVFHWHGDTFDLPADALHLAHSEACLNQAFVYGERVIGLQFHLETTPAGVQDLVAHGQADLIPGRYIQTLDQMLAHEFGSINRAMSELLTRIEQAAAPASASSTGRH